jgi:hypothetical protein
MVSGQSNLVRVRRPGLVPTLGIIGAIGTRSRQFQLYAGKFDLETKNQYNQIYRTAYPHYWMSHFTGEQSICQIAIKPSFKSNYTARASREI